MRSLVVPLALCLLGAAQIAQVVSDRFRDQHLLSLDEAQTRAMSREEDTVRIMFEAARRQRTTDVDQWEAMAKITVRLGELERQAGVTDPGPNLLDHSVDADAARRELMKGRMIAVPRRPIPTADE